MSKNTHFGYNRTNKTWLKSFGSNVQTTTNFGEATRHKKSYIETCIKGFADPEKWQVLTEDKAKAIATKNQRAKITATVTNEDNKNSRKTSAEKREEKLTEAQIRACLRGHSSVWRSTDMTANIQAAINEKDAIFLANVADRYNVAKVIDTLLVEKAEQMSQSDLALADVYHYVQLHNPPAHIRTKVYAILQKVLQERAQIKSEHETLRILKGMLDVEDTKKAFETAFADRQKFYQPRTPIYEELLNLY